MTRETFNVLVLCTGNSARSIFGVLIEVPLMLVAVRVVNNTRDWYERCVG